jgi:hypothetical protein
MCFFLLKTLSGFHLKYKTLFFEVSVQSFITFVLHNLKTIHNFYMLYVHAILMHIKLQKQHAVVNNLTY